MKKICVFCGSNLGTDPAYAEAARHLGTVMVAEGMELVYGGGAVGLMGTIADSVLQQGGKVTGVIPHFLNHKEIGHKGLTELITVDTMHERKTKMAELSDGFIAMPGGIGTLEELAEVFTWGQLGIHPYPVALLNVKGFYDPLIKMLDEMVEKRFLNPLTRSMLLQGSDPGDLLARMKKYQAPVVFKWLDRDQT